MTKFEIYYTMISHRTCIVEGQNEDQIQFLFDHERLDLNNEHYGSLDFGELKSIERIEPQGEEQE
jgi:hypothetical protein